jgi:hypothetical protein
LLAAVGALLVVALGASGCDRQRSKHEERAAKKEAPGSPSAVASGSTAGQATAAATASASAQPSVPVKPDTLRLVTVYSHELTRAEKMGLTQMRAELERPGGKHPVQVVQEPATEQERRFIADYLAASERRAEGDQPLPASWLGYETVVALPIHLPIPLGSVKRRAGYRDLLIFHPPARQAVFTSHYGDGQACGPNLGVELGRWLGKHLALRAAEAKP